MMPVVRRLLALSIEFEDVAVEYSKYGGMHNALLRDEAQRCARQLQVVAERVRRGEFSQRYGVIWLRAAWRIITAIGRVNIA